MREDDAVSEMEEKRINRFYYQDFPGANWRPTRLASTVPSSCMCSVCGMIPTWRKKLPCSHVLCPVCHAASSQNGAGLCPLDRQPFNKANSINLHLPTKEVRRFEVHCWNEVQGCHFVGPLEKLLWHYDEHCKFHVVECLRCAKPVFHVDLVKHLEKDCGAASSHSAKKISPSESSAGTPVHSSEDPAMLQQDTCSGLPAIMTLLNKAVQYAKRHEVWFNTGISDFKASMLKLKSDMAKSFNVVSSIPSRESSARASLLSETESAVVLRKLEHFAHMSINQLEHMRQMVTQLAGHRSVTVDCKALVHSPDRYYRLSNAVSAENGLNNKISKQVYALRFGNAEELFSSVPGSIKLADVTMPFTRDTYFTVVISKSTVPLKDTMLYIDIGFTGLLEDSRCELDHWTVRVKHPDNVDLDLEGPNESGCGCTQATEKYVHFHRGFSVKLDFVRSGDFLKNGCLMLEIQFDEA